MKKLIFTALSTLAFVGAFSQSPIGNSNFRGFHAENVPVKKATTATYGKTVVSDWYIPYDYAQVDKISGAMNSYVGFIQHDSLCKLFYSDGTIDHNAQLAIGRVLDPKDSIIDYTDNPGDKLSKYVGYTLDSIRFTYLYVRNVDSLPDGIGGYFPVTDTLFIAYYLGPQIEKLIFTNSGQKLAIPGTSTTDAWTGGNIRMPINYFKMDTLLLTKNDSTKANNNNGGYENAFRTKVASFKAPDGMTINASGGTNNNNLVGYAFTFKSAVPTVLGNDTAIMVYQKDPATIPAGSHRTNYFGYYFARNEGSTPWSNPTYFNTSLIVPWDVAYAPKGGWNGFVSGNAYTKEYFVDADFKLTSTANADVKEIRNDNFAMSNVYPNPAKAGQGAFIAFNLKSTSKVTLEIYNLMGQMVKTVANKTFESGANGFDMNLSGIPAGVYFINMTVNGVTQTKKLTIIE